MFKKSKGFTIIELIVVIAIIAILAAIVMVNVTQYINKSKEAAVIANMQQITTIVTDYIADPANGGSTQGLASLPQILSLENSVLAIKASSFCYHVQFANEYNYSYDGVVGDQAISQCDGGKWNIICIAPGFPGGNGFTYCVDSSGYNGLSKTQGYDCQCGE
ncbi:MAG: prepilin-type N-terminal cleavage/methylation domain-containing protein [Candidatus Staskawiczbacteria bacterium]